MTSLGVELHEYIPVHRSKILVEEPLGDSSMNFPLSPLEKDASMEGTHLSSHQHVFAEAVTCVHVPWVVCVYFLTWFSLSISKLWSF